MAILDDVLREVKHLPPLPISVVALTRLASREQHRLSDIVNVVDHDPALTANILRVVNSALFRPIQPINSLPMAITLLGEKTVMGISLGMCCSELYDRPLDGYESPRGELWKQSLRAAIIARELAISAAVSGVNRDLAYTAGLLHGIGKCVLSHYLANYAEDLAKAVNSGGADDFIQAERQRLGTDHCEIGYAVCRQWNLPEELSEAIRFYHEPDAAPRERRPLTYCVHVAHVLAMMSGDEIATDTLRYSLAGNYREYLPRLDAAMVERTILKSLTELSEALEIARAAQ